MANRNFPSMRQYTQHLMLCKLDAQIAIGASGAPTISTSNGNKFGIASITRLSAGTYRVQLTDNYQALIGMDATFGAPGTGSALTVDASDAALSVGTVYQIVTIGTSTQADFVAVGMPAGITAAVGVTFKASATGAGTGSGTVKAIGSAGISHIETIGSSGMLNNQPFQSGSGGYIDFQCLGTTITMASYTPAGVITNGTPDTFAGTPAVLTGTTGYAATDPANGSTMFLTIMLSNSSVQ